ncbi:hypothetical protein LEN26_010368 [Aphanomyces euteiches]|nr:hypothetical protein LEN26_010368 [Aphanomyces euteiches]
MASTAAASTAQPPSAGSASNKLNRELLRWLQSLDLAYSLKNIKRDFSNGFLIAEILSRYYDKDISMHSFDNGIGLKVKKDNWDQLLKFMQKVPDLDPLGGKVAADAVMHCENGAAVVYLGKLYQCLTKRELQTVQPRPVEEDIPPYAKPTGATLIREKMRGSDFAETSDELQIGQKTRSINARHEEALQLERITDTDRFGPASNESKLVRGRKQKLVGEESPVCTQAVVREVQIKTLDDKNLNLAQLRAMREANAAMMPSSNNMEYGVELEFDGVAEKGSVKRRAMDLLNEYIGRKLTGTSVLSQMDGRKERFDGFMEAIAAGGIIHDRDAADVLENMVDPGGVLSNVLLESPKDFFKLTGMLQPCLEDCGVENSIFIATVKLWTTMGTQCVKRDPNSAALLMSDYALPRLAPLLILWPSKRHALLSIVYSFSSPKLVAHIQVIKRLREALQSMSVFVGCLCILVNLETEMDETLADLYYYYCCTGLDMSCEKLRASCLSMIPRFLSWNAKLALDLIPRLSAYSTRSAWWEVKAQIILVATALVQYLASQPPCDQLEDCLTILHHEFTPNGSINIRRLGVAYISPLLAHFQELVPKYVDVLRSLPMHTLHEIVAPPTSHPASLPLSGGSGQVYHLPPVRNTWDSLAIAKQLFLDYKEMKGEHGSGHHQNHSMIILQACFEQLAVDQPDQVNELYGWTQSMVVDALEEDHTCSHAVAILSAVSFYSSPSINVLQGEAITSALERLCGGNTKEYLHRQEMVAKLLHQLVVSNQAKAVKECLSRLKSNARAFQDTPFAKILQDIK